MTVITLSHLPAGTEWVLACAPGQGAWLDYRHRALAPGWRVTALHPSPQAAVDEAARVLALAGRPLAEMAVAANDDATPLEGWWRWWLRPGPLGVLAASGALWLALAAAVWGAAR